MAESGLVRAYGWKVAVGLCALWNVLYVVFSVATATPVFIMSYFVPSYFFLPVYAWLVWGLWKEKYSAWIVGLMACAPFALRGIAKLIAILIHGNHETVLPMQTPLQMIGVGAIATNILMGVLLLLYRDEFSPE